MNEEKAEYRNKQRSSFWWATLMWCLLLILACFGADIIEEGKSLNETSFWGYVLWGIFALALWVLLVGPIIHFCNLRYVGEESLRRQVGRAGSAVKDYRSEPEDSELRQLADEFSAAPRDFSTLEGKNGWQELLARFREAVHGRAHDTIIGYCKAAGVGMVFCFNGLLEGLVLLAIQVRLVVVLARVFGYKPSAFFNGYFFGWIAVNSLAVALTSGLVENASASMVAGIMGATAGADIEGVRVGLEFAITVLIQALLAGMLTCITGRVFLWRLEYEGREVALKALLKLRADGRREYAAQMKGAAAALALAEEGANNRQPSADVAEKLMQLFGYGDGQPAAPALGDSAPASTEPARLPQASPAAEGSLLTAQKAEPAPAGAVPQAAENRGAETTPSS